MVAAVVGAIEIALIFILVPRGNYLTAAAIFSGYLVVSITWMVLRGLTILKREEARS
jgi:hypothetical protein